VSQVRLQPVTEQNVVSYVTMIDVPNPDMKLKPGMTANVTVEIARADDVLRVPNAALRFRASRGDGSRVWTIGADGQPRPIAVRTGLSDGTTTAILDGELTATTEVVTGVPVEAGANSAAAASPLIPRRPGAQGARQRGTR
jgi:HlyD family secretion protein